MTGNVLGPLDYMFGETLRVALVAAVAAAGGIGIVGRLAGWTLERAARIWLLVTSLVAIALFTQHNPYDQSGRVVDLNPFGDLEVAVNTTGRYRDIVVANVVLFIPLGVALAWRGMRFVRTVAFGMALSVAAEVLQYFSDSGRVAQTGDVIVNTAGAVIGWAIFVALTGGWGPLTHATGSESERKSDEFRTSSVGGGVGGRR